MPNTIPQLIVGGAAAGMFLNAVPRVVKIPVLVLLLLLAIIELNKDANESWFSSAIFGGQGEQGAAQMVDPKKTEAAAAAGREVSGARRTAAAQWAGLNADALQKEAQAAAATETEGQLVAKKLWNMPLTTTEELRLQELKKLRSEAETAQAQSTAARASAKAEKEASELSARLIESMQRNDGDILKTFFNIFVPRGAGLGK
jgi:hypothetical protein